MNINLEVAPYCWLAIAVILAGFVNTIIPQVESGMKTGHLYRLPIMALLIKDIR